MSTTEIVQDAPQSVATVQQDSTAAVLAVIARAAADPTVDVAKMQALLEMQERLSARESEMAFNQAMTRLQPKLPRITKRGRIEFGSGDKKQSTPFAKYEDIDAAIRPLLCAEGFSISFGTQQLEKGGLLVSATLAHVAGHSRTESMPLPFDTSGSKNSIQGVGSTLSYGKRYLVCAMLNIITEGEDNDAAMIGFINDQQQQQILTLISACEMDDSSKAKFMDFMGVSNIAEISKSEYQKAIVMLKTKLSKIQNGTAKR